MPAKRSFSADAQAILDLLRRGAMTKLQLVECTQHSMPKVQGILVTLRRNELIVVTGRRCEGYIYAAAETPMQQLDDLRRKNDAGPIPARFAFVPLAKAIDRWHRK